MSTDERDDTAPIEGERRRGRGSLATAIWTAADKGLPMLYGVAILLIPLNLGILDKAEFGRWTLFQSLFLAISLFGDYLLRQPMGKFAAEDN